MASIFDVHIDKENTSQGHLRLKSQSSSVLRGGKTFQSGEAQPLRKAFGDVNRNASVNGKPTQLSGKGDVSQKQNVSMSKQPWKQLKPAPPSKPLKQKNKSPQLKEVKEEVQSVTIGVSSTNQSEEEDIEEMHVEPSELDTFADIWAVDFPIIPDVAESSEEEDSWLSDVDSNSSFVIRDFSVEEAESGHFEFSLEIMPSIKDIPLPPLEDLVPMDEDVYNVLQ